MSDAVIEKIRKRYFNPVCYLEAIVKQTRTNGQDTLTPEQLALLQNVLSQKPDKAKKPKPDAEVAVSLD